MRTGCLGDAEKTVGWSGGLGVVARIIEAMCDCDVGGGVGVRGRRAGCTED